MCVWVLFFQKFLCFTGPWLHTQQPLSQSAWSFYQGKSNHSGVSLQMLSLQCISGRRILSQIQINSFVMLLPVFRNYCTSFKADLMLVLWNPPSNVSPVGHLIRSNHTVAHTSGLLYLHLNHLITPEKISPHNWMKRRNRSVTLACPTFISCLTSGCSGEKETPALVLIELRLDSQPEQRKGETGRLRPEMCMIMYAACLNTVVELLHAQFWACTWL